jgi:hypothetical protein
LFAAANCHVGIPAREGASPPESKFDVSLPIEVDGTDVPFIALPPVTELFTVGFVDAAAAATDDDGDVGN